MAGKRQHLIDYAEDSYSDEDEEPDPRPARPGRPRKMSTTTSYENVGQQAAAVADGTGTTAMPVPRRRGRGPSKRPCLNRNALMARENRQRKKEYIALIENKLKFLQQENNGLKETISKQSNDIKRLSSDVNYLRSILKNNTMITTLLKSMNDSLRKMHGSCTNQADQAAAQAAPDDALARQQQQQQASANVLNWVVSGQQACASKINVIPASALTIAKDSSEFARDSKSRVTFGQTNSNRIARKTMPFTNNIQTKSENPSSVESMFEDEDNKILQKSSPESISYCEYNTDKSSVGLDNHLPTTPMSALSNSMDKVEASLSDTDFSQLSSFNVDLFDNIDKFDEANPLQFEQDTPDLFNEDTLFHTLEKDADIFSSQLVDPLEINRMSEAFNEKNMFNCKDNAGVCLHINSSRVSLEYCSICHMNSVKSEVM